MVRLEGETESRDDRITLAGLAWVFLRLGATSFGGPAAHIALMHEELVVRRRWLSPQAFVDLVGATNLIPGPNSTEMAIHIGLLKCGWKGLLVAGVSFILPAATLVLFLAAAYVRAGARPDVAAAFAAVVPVVVAIVGIALCRLAAIAVRSVRQVVIAVAAVVAVAAGVHELAALAAAAVIGGLLRTAPAQRSSGASAKVMLVTSLAGSAAGAPAVAAMTVNAAVAGATLSGLALVMLKAGALLFGSGYVLFAFLRADLVVRLGWLTEAQLVDGIAIGQVTPGPLFTTATFVGYLLAGVPGAVIATVAIFLPAFVYVAVSGPIVPRLRQSPIASGVLDGVNAASLALMGLVTWQLASGAFTSAWPIIFSIVTAAVVGLWRVNPMWPMVLAALSGFVWQRVS